MQVIVELDYIETRSAQSDIQISDGTMTEWPKVLDSNTHSIISSLFGGAGSNPARVEIILFLQLFAIVL